MTITFTKLGDFYETYDEAARTVAKEIGLTLTKGRDGRPMCGVPYHCIHRYAHELERAGHTVEGLS